MPKKSLPTQNKTPQSLLKKLQLPQRKSQQKQKPKSKPTKTPDLLDISLYKPSSLREELQQKSRYIPAVTIMIVSVSVIYFLLLLWNTSLNAAISKKEAETESLAERIEQDFIIEEKTAAIIEKMEIVKDNLETFTAAEKIEFSTTGVPEGVLIKKVSYTNSNIIIRVESSNILKFTHLFETYLQNKEVNQLILSSATYRPSTEMYLVVMEIDFDE